MHNGDKLFAIGGSMLGGGVLFAIIGVILAPSANGNLFGFGGLAFLLFGLVFIYISKLLDNQVTLAAKLDALQPEQAKEPLA